MLVLTYLWQDLNVQEMETEVLEVDLQGVIEAKRLLKTMLEEEVEEIPVEEEEIQEEVEVVLIEVLNVLETTDAILR